MENNYVKLFRNPSTTVEVTFQTNSDGCMHAWTHAQTPNCCNSYASLTAHKLNKKTMWLQTLLYCDKYKYIDQREKGM